MSAISSEVALGDLVELSFDILEKNGRWSIDGSTIQFSEASLHEKTRQIEAVTREVQSLAVGSLCEMRLECHEQSQGLKFYIPPESKCSYFQRDPFIAYVFDQFVEVA